MYQVRISLKVWLILVGIACLGFGYIGYKVRAAIQTAYVKSAVYDLDGAILPHAWKLGPAGALEEDAIGGALEVNLTRCRVRGFRFDSLIRLGTVKRLRLDAADIDDSDLKGIAAITSLEELSLCGTNVTDLGVSYIARLPRLKVLLLDGTKVTDSGINSVALMSSLEEIGLRGTAITNSGLDGLGHLPRLRSLDISGTAIDGFVIDWLRKSSTIEEVFLDGLDVCDSDLNSLMLRRPSLTIFRRLGLTDRE